MIIFAEKNKSMTVYEIIELNKSALSVLDKNGIKTSDVILLDVYKEFKEMRNSGEKYEYSVSVLSDKYGICKTKIHYTINKFDKKVAV